MGMISQANTENRRNDDHPCDRDTISGELIEPTRQYDQSYGPGHLHPTQYLFPDFFRLEFTEVGKQHGALSSDAVNIDVL